MSWHTARDDRSAQQARALAILDTTLDAVIAMDDEGRIVEFNVRAEAIFGYRREAVIGRVLADVIIPEPQRERHRLGLARYLATGEARMLGRRVEAEAMRADGSVFPVELNVNHLPGSNPPLFAAFLRDLTHQKLAAELLHKQHRTLELLHRVSGTLIAELDLEKVAQAVIEAGREISGAAFGAFFYQAINEHGDRHMLYALSGVPNGSIAAFPTPQSLALFEPTLAGKAVIRISDVLQDPRYTNDPTKRRAPEELPPVRSYLAIPVVSRSSAVLGALLLGHPDPHHFDADAERSLVGLAAQAALAIDNATLHAALRREVARYRYAEANLRASEERFRTLAESLPNLVWTCRPDGWCDYLSRQWVEYTGQPAEEQLGSAWLVQLHPDDRARAAAAWTHATRTGNPYEVEFRIRRADGAYRWFKTRAVPLRDQTGRIVKWIGSNTDFEEHKAAEGRLEVQLERLALLDEITRAIGRRQDLRSVFQAVVRSLEESLSIDLAAILVHDSALETLSVACVNARGQRITEQVGLTEQSRVEWDENGLRKCLSGQLVHEQELRGSDDPFASRLASAGLRSVVAVPMPFENNVFGILIAARREPAAFRSGDCEFLRQLAEHVALAAHQVQMYEALRQAYEDLHSTQQAAIQQERLRALGQMASGVAHDINNALSPIAIYTDTLLDREPQLSPNVRGYLEMTQRAIDDVAHTVARLAEFYREREPQLLLRPVDLNSLVPQVVDLTRARWSDMPQQRGIVIEVRKELAHELPLIAGIESELREALVNLVFNAVDAMPEGGLLTLRTGRVPADPSTGRRQQAYVEVIDSGSGMDEVTRRRCLEPFFTTKGERGTGLGLAMVFGVARRHNAELDIESAPNKGTAVRVRFETAVRRAEHALPASSPPAIEPLCILVIDDDSMIARSLRASLEGDGHTVVSASAGQEGIDAFRAARPEAPYDMVITDLGMPGTDGLKVASAVKALRPSIPVILLTGWGRRFANDQYPHVDRVLSKPPKLHELRAALNDLIRRGPGAAGEPR